MDKRVKEALGGEFSLELVGWQCWLASVVNTVGQAGNPQPPPEARSQPGAGVCVCMREKTAYLLEGGELLGRAVARVAGRGILQFGDEGVDGQLD